MSPAPMAEEGTSMAETAMMDERSRKRLMTEARRMQSAANGVAAHPVDGNLQLWHAIISGPADCCWEGGIFRLEMVFTSTYPLDPPRVKFLTRGVFHPNVYVSGDICLDVLKNNWSPTLSIEALLISIMSLLSDPNPNSPANAEAAQLYSNNPESYDAHVRAVVKASLDQEFSDDDEDDEESVDDEEEGDE